MKKYVQKVLAVILIVGIFLLVQTRFSSLEKRIRTIANSKHAASSCVVGEPEIYYVTADGVRIRSSTVINDSNIIASVDKCTEVKVYCMTEEGDWAKISNSSEKYISTNYLSKNETCETINTTTTNPISLSVGPLTIEPDPIRVEDPLKITFDISNIKNVAQTEADRIDIELIDSLGEDASELFNIERIFEVDEENIGTMNVTITNKAKVTAGRYRIKINYNNSNSVTKTFDILKKEFNFDIIYDSDNETVPENLENTWQVEFSQKLPENLTFQDFDYAIKKNGIDYTDAFIFDVRNDIISFKNIKREIILENGDFVDVNDNYTPKGTYTFTLTLRDQEDFSSDLVPNYTRKFTFTITDKRSIFTELQAQRKANRYQISYQHLNYDIDVVGTENTTGVKKYIVRENNNGTYEEVKYSEQELKETYPNLAYSKITTDNRNENKVAVNYNNSIYIVKYTKEIVSIPIEPEPTDPDNPEGETDPENPGETTDPENPGEVVDPENPEGETDPENPGETTDPENPGETEPEPPEGTDPGDGEGGSGEGEGEGEPKPPETIEVEKYYVYYYKGRSSDTLIKEEVDDFKAANPSAYGTLMSNQYTRDEETGDIFYHDSGIGTKVVKNIVKQPDLVPLSITGGELKLKLYFEAYTQEEVANLQVQLVKDVPIGRAPQILVENLGETVYDSNFALELDYSEIADGYIYVTIKYLSNQDYYIGDYTLYYGFGKYDSSSKFTLSDGKIDYYVYSEYDNHSNDPSDILMTNYPNSNKKYEYYVGFYMKKTKVDIDNIEKDSIGYRIFDRRADEDEDGNIFFFDEVDYIAKINRIYNNTVYYDLSLDGGVNYQTGLTLPISEFATKYADAYQYISDYTPGATKLKYYNLDANGNLISDNFSMHVIRTFAASADATDLSVEYTVNGNPNPIVKVMNDSFKQTYSEMYRLIATTFAFDHDNNYLLGGIRGRYQITEENGEPLVGNEVTDQFYITVNRTSPDPKRTITILPKTEVNPGFYYIYVTHNAAKGVGYIYNDDSDDAAIDRNVYPEMWMRNIHMTSLHYDVPNYDVLIDNFALSNSISSADKAYTNVESYVDINFRLGYMYNLENFSYKIQFKDGNNWIDANDHFTITDNIRPTRELSELTSVNNLLTSSNIHMMTNMDLIRKGTYRIVFSYSNNGYDMDDVIEEFELSGNYYGLSVDNSSITKTSFYHNFASSLTIPVKGYYLANVDNFNFSMTHETDEGVPDVLTWNKENKTFSDVNDHILFSYTEDNVILDAENNLYTMTLMNYFEDTSNLLAPVGKYTLTISYQEPNGELLTDNFIFNVERDTFSFRMGIEKGHAKANEMYIERGITSQYINYEDLEPIDGVRKIQYIVQYFDPETRRYIDVSSESSTDRMFTITDRWEEKDPEVIKDSYNGNIFLHLNIDKIDRIFDGSFYLKVIYNGQEFEYEMASMKETFGWEILDADIYGLIDDSGKTHKAPGFYSNIPDTHIDVTLDTIHEENAQFIITQDCANASICSPDTAINFNNYFEVITHDNVNIDLKLKANAQGILDKGAYQLVIYYSSRDYAVYNFNIVAEYAEIKFGDAAIATKLSDNEISQSLFTNKDATIIIPVTVLGIGYEEATVNITNNNQNIDYNSYFIYSSDKFRNEHKLELEYNSNKQIPAGDVLVMVSYQDADGRVIEDHQVFNFSEIYFDYRVKEVTYDPSPAVPNREQGGEIILNLITNEMFNGNLVDNTLVKTEFTDNIIVKDFENKDVTSEFTKTFMSTTPDANEFQVSLRYEPNNNLKPGTYRVYMSYAKNTFVLNKTVDFTMADYERKIEITNVDIESKTKDGLIHNNYGGTYIVNFRSNYNILVNNMTVKVTSITDNTDVTNKFKITKQGGAVRLEYTATTQNLEAGRYVVHLEYRDASTQNITTNTTEIDLYGEYKEIMIKDIKASTSPIIAENDNQYYEFKVDTTNLTAADLNNLKFRVYDNYNNIVYSSISSDDVANSFDVIKVSNDTYRIKILPYKARVGTYYVAALLGDVLNNYNISNRLRFTIDQNSYRVNIFSSSSIVTKEKINNTDNLYDYIGVLGTINFSSNHPIDNDYSIKIINNGRVITEIKSNYNLVEEYKQITFDYDDVSYGNVEFALCIKGLPYASITREVLEYKKITDLSIIIDKQDLTGAITLDPGDVKAFELYISPEDATNKNMKYTSSNPDVAVVENNNIIAKSKGETTITVHNKEYSKTFVVNVTEALKSPIYDIDNENKIIFVNKMTELRLRKEVFISNIQNIQPNYKIVNNKNEDVTSTTEVVGTNYKLISGNSTYTIIVIGDLNGNGAIDTGDFAYLVRIVRNIITPDENILRAARILKRDNVTSGDVAKLYRFYRGNDNEI